MAESPKDHHDLSAEEMIFDANLQEFATKIGYVVGLESNCKLAPDEAYDRIKALWKQLKKSKKGLRVGEEPKPPAGEDEGTPER